MAEIGSATVKAPATGDYLWGQEGPENDASKVRRFHVDDIATAAQLAAETDARVAAISDIDATLGDVDAALAAILGV